MEASEIKRLYGWIQNRVTLADTTDGIAVAFDEPGPDDFEQAGFQSEAVELTLHADWWEEMVADVIETPDYAEAGEGPEQILQYARDVVREYIAKRLFT